MVAAAEGFADVFGGVAGVGAVVLVAVVFDAVVFVGVTVFMGAVADIRCDLQLNFLIFRCFENP